MTVEKFIEKYNLDGNKEKYIKSHIKTKYISYLVKLADCERIIKSTSYADIDENVYRQNSPARHLMFVLTLISRYTDIDVVFENGYSIQIYDALDEYDLINKIINEIPTHEYNSYLSILEMMANDMQENIRSFAGMFSSFTESIKTILNNLPEDIKGEING